MSIASQKNELNDLFKTSKNVKVIVLANGTVQLVDKDATNVEDGNPAAEAYAEITSTRTSGVQQREDTSVVVPAEVTKPAKTPKTPKVVKPAKEVDVTKPEKPAEVTATDDADKSTEKEDVTVEVTEK